MDIDKLIKTFRENVVLPEDLFLKVIVSVAIVIVLWLTRLIIVKVAWSKVNGVRGRYKLRKTSSYITFTLSFLLIGRVWFEVFQSLATLLGLLSAGLAIALKDLILNIAGWIYIIVFRPFEMGDRIQIGEYSGDVVDIRGFKFTLVEIGNWVNADQSTGRVVHVPNFYIFSKTLASYSKGFHYIWDEVPILITFESNWQKAKRKFTEIVDNYAENANLEAEVKLKEASKKFLIYYSKLTPIVYLSVSDSGVLLTLRYLCEPKQRRNVQQFMWENVLKVVDDSDDIDLAYPTVRLYRESVAQKHINKKAHVPKKPDEDEHDIIIEEL